MASTSLQVAKSFEKTTNPFNLKYLNWEKLIL